VLGAAAFGIPSEALAKQSSNSLRDFTADSLRKSGEIPSMIESVTPTGMCAQTMLCTLFPEKLASIVKDMSQFFSTYGDNPGTSGWMPGWQGKRVTGVYSYGVNILS
jgi:hypothetical protein